MVLARGQITISVQSDGTYPKMQYALGDSGVVPPISGWQDSPLSPIENKYLWQKVGIVIPPKTEPNEWNTPFLVGSNGDNAVIYALEPSVDKVTKSMTGVLTPPTLSCSAWKTVGNAARVAVSTEGVIYYQTSLMLTRAKYSAPLTLTKDIKWVDFELLDLRSNLIDKQRVPVLSDASDLVIVGRNLLKKSGKSITSSNYNINDYYYGGLKPVNGRTYTVSMKATLGAGKQYFHLFNSGSSYPIYQFKATDKGVDGVYRATFVWVQGVNPANVFARIFHMSSATVVASTIEWIKLEEGDVATEWTPAPEDIEDLRTDTESSFTLTNKNITSKVAQTDYDANKGVVEKRMSTIEQTAQGIISTVTSTEIGGRNYFLDSGKVRMQDVIAGDKTGYQCELSETWGSFGGRSIVISFNYDYTQTESGRIGVEGYFVDQRGRTIYCGAFVDTTQPLMAGVNHRKVEVMQVEPNSSTSKVIGVYLQTKKAASIWNIKVECGNKVTDWAPAPEDINNDLEAQKQISNKQETSITQLSNKIELRATKAEHNALGGVVNEHSAWIALEPERISAKVKGFVGRNYALGTAEHKVITGLNGSSNQVFALYNVMKEVSGGDLFLAFDYKLKGCSVNATSHISLQSDSGWGYYLGLWGNIIPTSGNYAGHFAMKGNLEPKAMNGVVCLRFDYISGGTVEISNFIMSKGANEGQYTPAVEDAEYSSWNALGKNLLAGWNKPILLGLSGGFKSFKAGRLVKGETYTIVYNSTIAVGAIVDVQVGNKFVDSFWFEDDADKHRTETRTKMFVVDDYTEIQSNRIYFVESNGYSAVINWAMLFIGSNVPTDAINMLDTGFDVENRKLTLTADKTTFRTNSGDTVAEFTGTGINWYQNNMLVSALNAFGDGTLSYYYPAVNGISQLMQRTVFTKNSAGNVVGKMEINYNQDGTERYRVNDKGVISGNYAGIDTWEDRMEVIMPNDSAFNAREKIKELNKNYRNKYLPRDMYKSIYVFHYNSKSGSENELFDNNWFYNGGAEIADIEDPDTNKWFTGYVLEELESYLWELLPGGGERKILKIQRNMRQYVNGTERKDGLISGVGL